MPPLPFICSNCRRPFDSIDPRRRLVVLETEYALCGECEWRATHPESLIPPSSRRTSGPFRVALSPSR
jgi:hypothetical protein